MKSWGDSLRAFLSPRVITMLFLGFSAGIPILLVFSTLSVWLTQAEVSRATIGFFSWAALGYAFKFIWAPLIDRLPVPVLGALLGRRRSWLLVAQLLIVAAIFLIAFNDPATNLTLAAVFAVMLGFSSATQDIVIDAYRIEAAEPEFQGLMSATYIAGYRIGMIAAGAGALEFSGWLDPDPDTYQYLPWRMTYLAMAGVMGVGIITTFVIAEPQRQAGSQGTLWKLSDYARFLGTFAAAAATFVTLFLISSDWTAGAKTGLAEISGFGAPMSGFLVELVRFVTAIGVSVAVGVFLVLVNFVPRAMAVESYVDPFANFFQRWGRVAFLILALIATYRMTDVVMGVMANVFYVELGFTVQEIGRVSKAFGLIMTITGGFLGGLLTVRYGVLRVLLLGGILAAATNVLFAVLAGMGPVLWMLAAIIIADNLSAGIASVAFVAYLSGLTSTKFTATQYAMFSSIMLLFPKLIAGYSGVMVDSVGYRTFFIGTAAMGIPVVVLILLVARYAPLKPRAD